MTRKPTLDASHVDGLLSYGSFNTLNVAGGVNVKLSDKAAIRADVSQLSSDSLYNVANNKTRSLGLTASLLVKPVEALRILVAVDHYNDRPNGTYQGAPLVQAATAREASNIVTTTNGLVLDRALARVNYNPDGPHRGRMKPRCAAGSTGPSAAAIAMGALPSAKIVWIEVPPLGHGADKFRMRTPNDPSTRFPHSFAFLDPVSERVVAVQDAERAGPTTTINNWLHCLHDASVLGLFTRWLAVLMGLVPAFLFGTGLWRWAIRKQKPGTL